MNASTNGLGSLSANNPSTSMWSGWIVLGMCLAIPGLGFAQTQAQMHYQQHCAQCHGANRLGAQGPALLPQNLRRLKKAQAVEVIARGRPATQMPAFARKLSVAQIQALVDYIYTPLPAMPRWGAQEITASRLEHHPPSQLSDTPKYQADMDNLFVVVELGDHHFTLLDGSTFEPIGRFPTRFAVHGGPKWAKGGRYVYFLSRDGWVSKFDVYNLVWTVETRAGINARNLAVSDDGRVVAVANYLPHTLVLLDAEDLSVLKVIPVRAENGASSRVSAVYTAAPRHSFIAALKDAPELWEINYEEHPPPGFGQWVHDYRPDSGELEGSQRFPIQRIRLERILDDFFLTQDYEKVVGSSRSGGTDVYDLDLKRKVASIALSGLPHLSSAISWVRDGKRILATPNIRKPEITVIDTTTWQVIKRIPTQGPGFFLRSHENSPYAWADVFFGPHRDLMHVLDKQRLEIVKTLRPAPGKTSAHVEFTKDGRYALVSIWDMEGALVIYDANTLEEVKRLPMKKPSGKYNVHNKLNRSEGTSH